MPFYIRFVQLYYLLLSILMVVTPLTYPIYSYLPAFAIMWFSFMAFYAGHKKGLKTSIIRQHTSKGNVKDLKMELFLFVCFLIVFIPLYIKFYTGNLLTSLIMGFGASVSSESNYQEYQRYFAENGLNQFSLSKLPYIVGFGLAKIVYYFMAFCYICYSKKNSLFVLAMLVVMFVMFFLVGVGRGTNFESFELLVILVFSILARAKLQSNLDFFSKKQMIYLGVAVLLIGIYFQYSKSLRSGGDMLYLGGGATSTLTFDKNHWSVSLIPTVAAITLGFSGYFLFGPYYTSEMCWKLWFGSIGNFIGAFFPFANLIMADGSDYRAMLISAGVDTGACWDPDCTKFIWYFGLPIFLFIVYKMGIWAAKAYKEAILNRDVGYCLLLYLLVYQMVSFPVGNFLLISSSNKIMLLVIIFIIYFNIFKRYRLR